MRGSDSAEQHQHEDETDRHAEKPKQNGHGFPLLDMRWLTARRSGSSAAADVSELAHRGAIEPARRKASKQPGDLTMTIAAMTAPSTAVVKGSEDSAVAWGAVIGGAVTAAAMTLVMLALGTGLGFSIVSPWSDSGVS